MEKIAEFGKAILDFILWLCWIVYLFFVFIFEKIVSLLSGITLPIMPTATRIFQEKWIVTTLLTLILLFIIIMSVSAFNLFRKDKILSKTTEDMPDEVDKRYERISERRLLVRCFFGGAIGGYLSMQIFRHKTLKPKFNIGVAIMAIVQLLIYSSLIGYFIFWLCLA